MNSVMLMTAIAGLAMLVGLAWIIGRADAHARAGAWRRVAAARKNLWLREEQLTACLDEPMCRGCPMRRYLRGQDQHRD